jgi:hypothetical protein
MVYSAQDYKRIVTAIIQNQIIILGPAITLAKVRHVRGLSVEDDGTVTSISETPENITKELISQFNELSPFITKKTLAPLIPVEPTSLLEAEEQNHEHKEEQHVAGSA